MKFSIMWHFIRVDTDCKGNNIFRQTNAIFIFLIYNLTPLYMYNGLGQVIISNQKEEFISILRVNGYNVAYSPTSTQCKQS